MALYGPENHRRMKLKRLFMARTRRYGHVRGTSGMDPTSDILSEMSASPPGPDLPGGALVRLVLTQAV